MTRRWPILPAVVLALAGVLTACGIGVESQPKVIQRADVPFRLAQRAPGTPTTTVDASRRSYTLYFLSGTGLRAVVRSARTTPSPAATLRALVQGPDPSDAEAGLRTLLDPEVSIERVSIDHGLATVELGGPGSAHVATDEQALGVAQLVYTATALPGVERVRFLVDGRPAAIPRGDGTLTNRAVVRADYPAAAS
jgi:spore germination protein GerM